MQEKEQNEGDVWRCSVCKKTKSLLGSHLDGKITVRSDCWPCAKKQTFYKESLAASRALATAVTAPFLFKPNALVSLDKSSSITLSGAVNAEKNLSSNPFAQASASVAKLLLSGTSSNPPCTNAAISSGNPFFTAAVASTITSQRGNEAAVSVKKPSSSSCKNSPIVMHSAPSLTMSSQSPPFTFTAASETPTKMLAASSKSMERVGSEPRWVCSVCKKVKDLSGDHLKGKTTVRSDCWPCAKKRNFILSTLETCNVPDSFTMPFRNTTITTSSSSSAAATTTATASKSLLCNAGENDAVKSSECGKPFSNEALWQHPHVPANDGETNIFIPHSTTQQSKMGKERSSTFVALYNSAELGPAMTSPLATFEGEVLRGYRQQLVDGIRTRTAWHNRTLYVVVPGSCKKNKNKTSTFAVSQLGQAAVVFLEVEHKLAQSPFRLMRRLFCPDEFIFAAACVYANTFLAGHHTSPQQSSFVVYGPQVDPTVPVTQWGSVINQCVYARQRVVSGEQRVEGAQNIFCNTGWLTLPLHATAEAIRLAVKKESADDNNKNERKDAELLGVDVVLVAETMRLEELSQAAALALPVKPFLK